MKPTGANLYLFFITFLCFVWFFFCWNESKLFFGATDEKCYIFLSALFSHLNIRKLKWNVARCEAERERKEWETLLIQCIMRIWFLGSDCRSSTCLHKSVRYFRVKKPHLMTGSLYIYFAFILHRSMCTRAWASINWLLPSYLLTIEQ